MTVTRSKTGNTPKKPELPDFVETPGTKGSKRSSRKSLASDELSSSGELTKRSKSRSREPNANGSTRTPGRPRKSMNGKPVLPSQIDHSPDFEFGGSWGVTAMMVVFPLLMYYMWVGAIYYGGKVPLPVPGQNTKEFLIHIGRVIYDGAFPTLQAWIIYWVFFIVEGIFYLYMPGVWCKGKPLDHLGGKALDYYCSGMWSFYSSIALAGVLHFTGIFKLSTLVDEFGPIMSVSIISGFMVSIVAYVSAIYRAAQHRMTGHLMYDFFMGAELNPRMFKWLDFKMFFEVRLPWFILFFVTLGACTRQYEDSGYVTGELGFLLMAHWLYANACCKGEELIPTTWDMYYEKWGFMLIFWNMAGVPLSYCHATIYLATHAPSVYRWNKPFLVFLYVSYLFAYWIWDTCGSQKNNFRGRQRGTAVSRVTFPQLPWRHIENPQTIPVENGDDLLCDGWYKYARKIHYTCDTYFAICWALVTGFGSPFPWFYPVFFLIMIIHRAQRDIAKCRERYGKSWAEFERRTPYLFIPYVY